MVRNGLQISAVSFFALIVHLSPVQRLHIRPWLSFGCTQEFLLANGSDQRTRRGRTRTHLSDFDHRYTPPNQFRYLLAPTFGWRQLVFRRRLRITLLYLVSLLILVLHIPFATSQNTNSRRNLPLSIKRLLTNFEVRGNPWLRPTANRILA